MPVQYKQEQHKVKRNINLLVCYYLLDMCHVCYTNQNDAKKDRLYCHPQHIRILNVLSP